MLPILGIGFVLGMRHALEADHVAAVAALSAGSSSLRTTMKVATAWGVGHASSLLALGLGIVLVGSALPEHWARGFEYAAGAMLVLLGIDLLWRVGRAQGPTGHTGPSTGSGRTAWIPPEAHSRFLLRRATLVGGVHGLGGTGALVLLAVPAMGSQMQALGGLALFGIGTISGMVLFSAALALPLGLSVRFVGAARWLEALVGVTNVLVGCWMLAPAFS